MKRSARLIKKTHAQQQIVLLRFIQPRGLYSHLIIGDVYEKMVFTAIPGFVFRSAYCPAFRKLVVVVICPG